METFIARQPILNKHNKIFGFELLFRDSNVNIYNYNDGDEATLEVLRNIYLNFGMNKIIGNKKAFVNFTGTLLKSEVFNLIPSETLVIEILENIEPEEDIIDACKILKQKGFMIALDDFVFHKKYEKLIEIADIIKIDFRKTKGIERRNIIRRIKLKNVKFLAEKVETMEEFTEAVSYGYSLFQGYYFSKPVMMSSRKIPENKMIYMKLFKELNGKDLNFDAIENLVKLDISISYKLLKLINSASFGLKNNIKSLRHALNLLGGQEIKIWVYFLIMKNISVSKPDILLQNSLIRAKFCELIAHKTSLVDIAENAYLMGMLSLIDIILDNPMDVLLEELMVPAEVGDALLDLKTNILWKILHIVRLYEVGDWNEVVRYSEEFQLSEEFLSKAYIESCEWVNGIIS
ncbi:MAG: HDOD domain-containing protein [Clostridiaceae bacterium]|nr:HDOD domain-containing protein [Clostridiaceae bacterium]